MSSREVLLVANPAARNGRARALIPAVTDTLTALRDSPAWAAIRRAYEGGAVIAGASAGAMALAGRCWTPAGRPWRSIIIKRRSAPRLLAGRIRERRAITWPSPNPGCFVLRTPRLIL